VKRLVLVFSLFLSAHASFAEDSFSTTRSTLRKRLSGDLTALLSAREDRPFRIHVLTDEGKIHFRLRRVNRTTPLTISTNASGSSETQQWERARLFKGYLLGTDTRAIKSVTADIIRNRLRFTFFGPRRGNAYAVEQQVSPRGALIGEARVLRRPSTMALICNVAALPSSEAEPQFPPTEYYSPRRVLEMSMDADREFHDKWRGDTVAEMEALANTVDAIFSSQIGIRVILKGVDVFTSGSQPYRSEEPFALLTEFQDFTYTHHHLPESDTYHLLTGKTLSDQTIGFGYVGEVCKNRGRYAFGLTQRFLISIQALIMAHEIGHNLGAHHPEEVLPTEPERSLMTGVVQAGNSQFSAFSVGEITAYVDQNGRCLGRDL
jgi:hypothetical protein